MGHGIRIICNKCGHSESLLEGIGFLHLQLLMEIKKGITKGTYGKKAQRYLEEHPEAKIDARYQVYQCPECKALKKAVHFYMTDVDSSFEKTYRCGKCRKAELKKIELENLLKNPYCTNCGETKDLTNEFMLWD